MLASLTLAILTTTSPPPPTMKRSGNGDEGGIIVPKVPKRQNVVPEGFDLNGVKPIDFNILGRELHEENLNTTAKDPYEFVLETGTDWIDLTEADINFTMKLTKSDGGNLTADLLVAPLNNIARNLFRWIKVTINGTQIGEKTDAMGAHYAYIRTIMNTDKIDTQTFLTLEGWYPDTGNAANFSSIAATDGTNTNQGFIKRQDLFKESTVQKLSLPFARIPGLDLSKPVPPKTKILIELYPAKKQDVLIGKLSAGNNGGNEVRDVKIVLDDMKINYHTWILESGLKMRMDRNITTGTHYVTNEMDSIEMRRMALQNGLTVHKLKKVFTQKIPKRIFFVIIPNKQFRGAIGPEAVGGVAQIPNPYVYKRNNLIRYEVTGGAGYQEVKLENHELINGYKLFIRGRQFKGDGTVITFDQWKDTHCIHIIDTTPHGDYDDSVKAPKIEGDINIELEFSAVPAAPADTSVHFFAVTDKVLMLDSLQSVFFF